MVDVDRLITVELKLPVHLLPVERLGLFLRHPDEDNAVAHLPLPAEVVGDVVLPLFVLELVNRYVLSLRLRLHRFTESLRYPSEHHRRWNRHPQLEAHEHRQPRSCCQFADVAVEVKTVEALDFQRDVSVQAVPESWPSPDFTKTPRTSARRFEVEDLASITVLRNNI